MGQGEGGRATKREGDYKTGAEERGGRQSFTSFLAMFLAMLKGGHNKI